jgi:acetylornithine deacetylase
VPHSTLHVGKISGGSAVNIIADRCQIDWEIRHLPGDHYDTIRARIDAAARALESRYPGLRIDTVPTTATVAALQDRDNTDWLTLLAAHLPGANKQHVAYATEAGAYQQAGMQTLICGPGSIRQAHQADEWIETAQLQQCTAALRAVIAARCT